MLTLPCRLPILLSYHLSEKGRLKHHQTLTLAGNVLDVSIGPALWDIVVSIDTVHKPGSVRVIRPEETPATEAFETLELFSNLSGEQSGPNETEPGVGEPELRWEKTSLAMLLNEAASNSKTSEAPSEAPPKSRGTYSALGENIYGLENLRKKRGSHGQEDEAEDIGDEIPGAPDGTA